MTALTYGVPEGDTLPVATYDSATDSWSVTDGTNTVTLTREEAADIGGFQGYSDLYSSLWMAESPSGDLLAGFGAVDVTESDQPRSVGGTLVRQADGTLPTGGNASYTGGYSGILQWTDGGRLKVADVTGDAALAANFDAGTVSGAITNRTAVAVSGTYPMADVTLSSTSIGSNRSFSGSVTGGELEPRLAATTTGVLGTSSGGTYDGLFGGDNGNEVAVGVHVDHLIDGRDHFETGAFIATQ